MSDELRVMRWIVCLLLFLSFNIQAQEHRVTLHLHEAKVEDALREVERQTGLTCSYESLLLQGLPPVSIDLDRVPLEDALDCILQGTWAAWTRLGDYIVLKRREEIDIPSDTLRNHQLQEILVEADSLRHNTGEENADVETLSAEQIQRIPVIFGQSDLVRSLQQLPGVSAGAEGIAGMYVRGGNNDENLFLLDDMSLYAVSHLGGLFSPFNPDAIKQVDFYKSGFPARYGGRLSSVVDIRTRQENSREYHGALSLGLTSGSVYVEGPILKDRLTFHFGLRRSWVDVISSPTLAIINWKDRREGNSSDLTFHYAFHDLNARIDYQVNPYNRLSLVTYSGGDRFTVGEEVWYGKDRFYHTKWGNFASTLKWESYLSTNLKLDASLSYTRYYSDIERSEEENEKSHLGYSNYEWVIVYDEFGEIYYTSVGNNKPTEENVPKYTKRESIYNRSLIQDYGLRLRFLAKLGKDNDLRFGTGYQFHDYRPIRYQSKTKLKTEAGTNVEILPIKESTSKGSEWLAYLEDEMRIGRWFRVNAGLHLSVFSSGRNYWSLQPRLAMQYALSRRWKAKLAYSRMSQFVHLVPSTYFALPNDVWFPTTEEIRPMVSDQIAGGIYYRPTPVYRFALEGYFKRMDNLLEFRNGAIQFEGFEDWRERLAEGSGRSYGLEFSAHRDKGKITGWVGYTLSWSDRHFPELNGGKRFPSRFDNRHKVNIVALWRINKKLELNAAWMFHSGNRITLPLEAYALPNGEGKWSQQMPAWAYGERNNVQLPNYHRLDLGLNIYHRTKRGRLGIWNISIYNAYCRMNVFTIRVESSRDKQEANAKSMSFLPIIPMASYTWKF